MKKKVFNKINLREVASLALAMTIIILFWPASVKADTATTTVRLQIKTNDASLYDGDIDVVACTDRQTASTTSINALCALEQSGLVYNFSWSSDMAFLNSVGAYANDYVNGIYWGWFENLNYSNLALNQYVLRAGDKILLAYNTNPLKVTVDNAAPYVGATSTITVEQFGLDASWNPVWSPAASSTLVIAGLDENNDSGAYIFTSTTTAPVLIYGKKSGYIDSGVITITAQAAPVVAAPAPGGGSVIIVPVSGGGGGSLEAAPSAPAKVDLGKAIDFLISKQGADGSFGSALQTDWAAMALASANANGGAAQKVKNYLFADPNPLAGLNPVSDYARRVMALMSLNINPYDGVKTNYVKKIIDLYDGRQFGDVSLYNDDIFALLVLNKAGYTADDEIVQNTLNFIISKQQADGSWAGSDLTAAAVQALVPLPSLDGVSAAIAKARSFLFNAQSADGGFGNTYTTAWAMQAIAALGEDMSSWQKNNQTPESYLALSQGADGGLEKDNTYEANRLWSTAYAVPAVLGKPWFSLMQNFSKPAAPEEIKVGDLKIGDLTATTTMATTTDITATSTLEIIDLASSTPEIIEAATSTAPQLINEKPAVTARQPEVKLEEKRVIPALSAKTKITGRAVLGAEQKAVEPENKANQPAPAEKVIADAGAPPASPPAAKPSLLINASRLIYRGLKYLLSLLGF